MIKILVESMKSIQKFSPHVVQKMDLRQNLSKSMSIRDCPMSIQKLFSHLDMTLGVMLTVIYEVVNLNVLLKKMYIVHTY